MRTLRTSTNPPDHGHSDQYHCRPGSRLRPRPSCLDSLRWLSLPRLCLDHGCLSAPRLSSVPRVTSGTSTIINIAVVIGTATGLGSRFSSPPRKPSRFRLLSPASAGPVPSGPRRRRRRRRLWSSVLAVPVATGFAAEAVPSPESRFEVHVVRDVAAIEVVRDHVTGIATFGFIGTRVRVDSGNVELHVVVVSEIQLVRAEIPHSGL